MIIFPGPLCAYCCLVGEKITDGWDSNCESLVLKVTVLPTGSLSNYIICVCFYIFISTYLPMNLFRFASPKLRTSRKCGSARTRPARLTTFTSRTRSRRRSTMRRSRSSSKDASKGKRLRQF